MQLVENTITSSNYYIIEYLLYKLYFRAFILEKGCTK